MKLGKELNYMATAFGLPGLIALRMWTTGRWYFGILTVCAVLAVPVWLLVRSNGKFHEEFGEFRDTKLKEKAKKYSWLTNKKW